MGVIFEDPTEIDDILRVPVWNTYFVKNENIILAKSKLQENGCIYINDLRSEDGQFLTYMYDDFKRMYNMNRLNVLDYYSLIRCIPKEWRDVLSVSNARLENCEGNALLNEMNTTSKVCKMIYSKLIKKLEYKQKSCEKCDNITGSNITEGQWKRYNKLAHLI